ncbi:MAG: hypothetical protein FRX48_09229 [Lasallia pustulata]|uniref:NACHT domain-containing protein n=1 Tax=Lasallia pustulata TaxID=136370 RepID=A0A5M8PCG3_9LECA|nr:MAG: hypothetical protein FRX48_09229 [Lasallia pustulata]
MANRNLAHRILIQDYDRNPPSPNAAEMGGAGYQEASSPPHNTMVSRFSRILNSFKTHLSQEDVDRFKVATFNDLKSAVKDIQTEQAGRKSLRNLNKIRPYLDGLEQYAAVIEVFVNSKPDILAFIWGPIKFCLKIASNFLEAFDALLDAYKKIGDALPIFSAINDLFSSHSHVQQVLVNLYEDILDFHGRAVRFFRQKAWKITMKLAFRTFRSMFEDVLKNLERSKDLLYRSADIASFREAQDSRALFQQQFDAQEERERRDRKSTVLEWLSHESCERFHEELQEKRKGFPNTARWIFQETAYNEWLSGTRARDQPFWISGIPGAGKTVLFSSIVDEIKSNSPKARVAFFYCKYNNVLRNSYQEIVKSVIAQLLYKNDDCLRYLYDKAVTSPERHPSTGSVLEDLIVTMAQLHRNLFLGIDGVDECEPSERRCILSLVHNLLKLSDTELDLKVFLASCTEKDIEESLQLSTHLALKPHHLDSDIRSYIDIRSIELGEAFSFNRKRVHEVACKVAGRPKGMFLLARLIMDNLLEQETWEDVDEELGTEILPRRIDEAYGRILLRIRKHENAIPRVKHILGMMTVAKRPLWLHEIQGALSIRLDDKSIDLEHRKIRKHLKAICGSIVEVHEYDSAELIHHTAKTFLEQTHSEQFINADIANRNMATLCLSYLTFDCIALEFNHPEYLKRVEMGEYAFLEYSICYWIQHMHYFRSAADEVSEEIQVLMKLSHEVLGLHSEILLSANTPKNGRYIATAGQEATWELLDHVQESFEAAHTIDNGSGQLKFPRPKLYRLLLHIRGLVEAASEESTGLSTQVTGAYGMLIFKCPIVRCRHFHEGFRSRTKRDGHVKGHQRPFRCAIEDCDYQIFGFASEAALTAHSLACHDSSCEVFTFPTIQPRSIWKCLEDAIHDDDAIAVRALCEEVMDLPDAKTGFLLRAVEMKSFKAACAIAELLGGNSKEMNHQGQRRRSALHVAAELGEEDLVRFISGTSADVNRRDAQRMSPICIAAGNGHVGVVQILLQHDELDMSLESKSSFLNTPLLCAAAAGHLEVVGVLLEDGAQQYVPGGHFLKALNAAGVSRHEAIIRFMLEKGSTVFSQNMYDKKLAAALNEGAEVAVKLLLQRRSMKTSRGEVDETGKTYGNALQFAASRGDGAKIKGLLDQGADINNVSGNHGSALQAAARQGKIVIVQLLLDSGASINAAGGYHGSALQAAAYLGDKDTVQLLLNNGADVNATGGKYGSALKAAAYDGHKDTVQLLLNNGADVNATGGKYGSALKAAALHGHEDTAQMLLNSGADVNATGGQYGSALKAAAGSGHKDTVQLLLNNGADVNATGGQYGSALSAAAYYGRMDTVQLLLNNGADVNTEGGMRGSVLLAAKKPRGNVNPKIVEYLEEAIRKSGREVPTSP